MPKTAKKMHRKAPPVPFVDLRRFYRHHRKEIETAVRSVLQGGRFILGDHVSRFEKEFAAYFPIRRAVAVSSGTDALHLAVRALGIGEGDEIITVANTCVPTVEGILMAGAKPVFVDIDPDTLLMEPRLIERAITSKTKAIVPVHLYGRPCRMDEILSVAARHRLKVVEDCAQAHGAVYKGRKVGTFGDAGCFSFYPTKNLGAFGDAGAVIAADAGIAEKVRLLRSFGEVEKYHHLMRGFNSRMDDIQAAVLRVKLRHLDHLNRRRRATAALYREGLKNLSLACPPDEPGHVYHLFVVRVKNREEFRAKLKKRGAETLVHYPAPIPAHKPYRAFSAALSRLPETVRACREVVSLPFFAEITQAEVRRVIACVQEAAG